MYLYFDKSGVLKEIINDSNLRKASSNIVYAYFEGDRIINDIFFYIKKSNGETLTHTIPDIVNVTHEVEYSKERKLKYFEYFKKYNFYKYVLQNEDLNVAGLWELSIQAYDFNSVPFAFGTYIGNVENNAIKSETNITQSEYELLKKLIATKSNWTDVETYIGVTREEVKPTNYTDYLKKNVFNLSFESLPYDETRVHKIKFNNESYIVKNYDEEIDNLKNQYNALLSFDFEVLDKLPTSGEKGKLYWLNLGNNLYDVYIWNGARFVLVFDDLDFLPTKYTTIEEFEALVKETATDVDYIDKKFTLLHDTTEITGQIDKIGVDTFNRQDVVSKSPIDREYESKGGTIQNISKDVYSRKVRNYAYENDFIEVAKASGTLSYAVCERLISDINNYIVYKNNILRLDVKNTSHNIFAYENLNYILTLDTETCKYTIKETSQQVMPFVQRYRITTQGEAIGGIFYFNCNLPSSKISINRENLSTILRSVGPVPIFGQVNNKQVISCEDTQDSITRLFKLTITFSDNTTKEYEYANIRL